MHGLSVIDSMGISDPLLTKLSELISQEGVDNFLAQELANRIVSYERNQAYLKDRDVGHNGFFCFPTADHIEISWS